MRLVVSREVEASSAVLWDVLTRWELQPEWMLDAKAVEVLTPWREGVGVVVRCPTNLLGVTVEDVMRVTRWEPPDAHEVAVFAVVHLGSIITGEGAFELEPLGAARTRVTWREEVDPPLGALGERGASALRPVLALIFGRSLRRLATLAEAEQSGVGPRRDVDAG